MPSLLNVRRFGSFSLLVAALACSPLLPGPVPTGGALAAQSGAVSEWRYWGGDAGSTRFSALDQIHPGNAGELEVAWRWTSANFGPDPETYYRATPLYADGRLFTVAGTRRAVVAIDPSTGETLWTWRMDEGARWEEAPRRFSGRGLAYWGEGAGARVYVTTPGYRLVALDPATGIPDPAFGVDGVVDLKEGLGFPVDPLTGIAEGEIGPDHLPSSHGVWCGGGEHLPGTFPRAKRSIPGHIRLKCPHRSPHLDLPHHPPTRESTGHDTWRRGPGSYIREVGGLCTLGGR